MEKEVTYITIEVPAGYREQLRLDRYITRFVENASRSKVQQAIKEGNVSVNGEVVDRASYAVQAGDRIVCRVMRPPPIEAAPEPIPLDVVYEDAYLLVVDKPAGMVVHPAYGHRSGTLVNALLHHVGAGALRVEEAGDDEEFDDEEVGLSTVNVSPTAGPGDVAVRPGIVHRLDKDTSGLLVVAKDDETHRALALQFAERTIRRRYLALVWGAPEPPAGRIEGAIGRDLRDRKRMAVVSPERGKFAATNYETVEVHPCTALVAFRLETGRTHQIRVHARQIGHPVFADETYGGSEIRCGTLGAKKRAFFYNLLQALGRQALHAHTLGFVHPRTGEMLDFEAPLPPEMQHVLDRLRAVGGF